MYGTNRYREDYIEVIDDYKELDTSLWFLAVRSLVNEIIMIEDLPDEIGESLIIFDDRSKMLGNRNILEEFTERIEEVIASL